MRRALLLLLLLLVPLRADAHVGSPDVFFEGDAGPYKLFVTVRMPQVIPGIAEIEIRSAEPVERITVVPLRLTGPGSELPPSPDEMSRSSADPQFFTASLWLMEHGSLQVRIAVTGAHGSGTLAVPIPAAALAIRTMDRGLGTLLLSLMVLLALALVSIAGAAVREVALDPGVAPEPRRARRARWASLVAAVLVVGLLAFGSWWWSAEARTYAEFVQKPWVLEPRVDGCKLTLPRLDVGVMSDHGHDMHLFVIREPGLDRAAHLHPTLAEDYSYEQQLPSLPAGRYRLFADIVASGGFPVTGVGMIDLPDLHCGELTGDDSMWDGTPDPRITLTSAPDRAHVAAPLAFHVTDETGAPAQLEPYMMMAGHAMVMKKDLSVFAHLHPSGSVSMPALMLAGNMGAMVSADAKLPADVSFPYGFPSPGSYRVFVQVKRAGKIETGAFDLDVK